MFSGLYFHDATAVNTATEVIHHAHHAHHHVHFTLANNKLLDTMGVGILLASVGLKEWFFQATMRIARKTDSSVLEANAWHHRVDALTAIVALVGLSGRVGKQRENEKEVIDDDYVYYKLYI